MTQQTSPFLEAKYGWNYGESGWNTGMDENLTKFSFLFDKNIDGIVSSLPSVVNGTAYFLTTDNRIYFGVSNSWYSTPTPKWFTLVLRSTGASYQFNGASLVSVANNAELSSQVQAIQVTLSSLGTAAFQPTTYFASQAALDVASAQANTYTNVAVSQKVNTSDLSSTNSLKGVSLVYGASRVVATVADMLALPNTVVQPVFTLGYAQAGDGGAAGPYYWDASDSTSVANGGTIFGTGTGRRKLSVSGEIDIRKFGANTSLTDNGPAINASLAAVGYALIPNGTFTFSTPIQLNVDGQRIIGKGQSKSILSSTTTTHSIVVAENLQYWQIKNLSLTAPLGNYGNAVGKDGIHCNGYVQLAQIDNVEVFRHWRGMALGPTSYSIVSNYLVDNNYDDGIHVEGTASIGAMQWTFIHGISQRNNGCGMKFATVAGPVGASMGDMVAVSTYGNKIDGISFQAVPACPINAIRIRGAFVGEEGRHGLHLDTYGVSTHTVAEVFSEICGTLACGVDGTTPATNQGRGFNITANQQEVIMTGCNAIGNSWSGLVSQCPRLTVTGGSFRLNGAALLAGETSGIQLVGGSANVTGIRANGNKGFGVYLGNDNHTIISCDLRENITADLGAGVAIVNSIRVGNLPSLGTGWTAATGTSTRSTFATSSVTLPVLAEHVKALIDDLVAQGIIRS